MKMTLAEELKSVLIKDERFVSDGQLLKNRIVELGLKLDNNLIRLLLTNKRIKEYFFSGVDNILIFDKEKFMKFVDNKEFLPSSYTAFKNKIGITSDNTYLSHSNEVVLLWPYKDCILEGGQEKEDEKRKETFHNEILAPDEIDRLLEPKVFTNFKRINSKGEHRVTEIKSTDNFIIRGNNLLVLHSIAKQYQGKIKLIYIDPPYNTGNDSFGYNDKFNHSTWLTFMKNRLDIAKELLSDDGTIIISMGNYELGYILVLMDEIFGRENRKNLITVKRSSVSGPKSINEGVVNVSDFLIVYSKNTKNWKTNRVTRSTERDERYSTFIVNYEDNLENWEYCPVLQAFAKSKGIEKNKLKKELRENYEPELENFYLNNSYRIIRLASLDESKISDAVFKMKKISLKNMNKTFIHERESEGLEPYYIHKGQHILFLKDRIKEKGGKKVFVELIDDIWDDVKPNDLHNEGGVSLKKGKKPEKLIGRIIELVTNKGDIVLDYHLGSGTTSAVAHKMGRAYIGIEQLDYGKNDAVTRLKNVIGLEKSKGKLKPLIENYDTSGISKVEGWTGGGDFVYFEIKELNEEFIQKIRNAKDIQELLGIWKEMKAHAFLSYNIDVKSFDENIEAFKEISDEGKPYLKAQKDILIRCLELNNIYINYSEIDDNEYDISNEDKDLNNKFYERI